MNLSKRSLVLFIGLLFFCITQSGCALIQLPFQALGTAVGVAGGIAGQAAQTGIAAAPYAAPFFL
jgi:hypothetical protein